MSVNGAIAERFEQISRMMTLLGEDSFRASAHARAARSLADYPKDLSTLSRADLLEIEGVGPKIADKIVEFCTTGRIKEYDDFKAKVPAGLLDLMNIPGLGPKTVALLWKDRGVVDKASLLGVIADGSILTLPGMGAKKVENIKKALEFAATSSGRLSLGLAMPIAERFVERLSKVKGVEHIAFAGSLRRGKETIGDIDILVAASDPEGVSKAFRSMPEVREVLAAGETKSSVRVTLSPDLGRWKLEGKEGDEVPEPPPAEAGPTIQVDLRVLPAASWGAALMYFTGSKEHNVRLRERALKMGYTLNEYGLFPEEESDVPPQHRGAKPVAAKTEEQVYKKLGLPYIPPEIREDRAELDLKETPRLIEVGDIKAELHAHTTASDGAMSIEELAARAKERGFHTIAVTDHSQSATIANGLKPDRLAKHVEAVRKAAEKTRGITILAGSEVDILPDGSLDYKDKVLATLDVVIASPHASLSQDPDAATKRILAAMQNPYVHIVGHPTGRLVNRRPGLSPDIGRLISAAIEHNIALEINAHWMRLDLRDVHVRQAMDTWGKADGCLIAIDCDVHLPEDFDNLRYGVLTGRRGWLTPDRCVNTWTAKRLHGWLKSKK